MDVFSDDRQKLEELKAHYQRGGLGDMGVKKYLLEVLQSFLEPIRKKRKELEANKEYVLEVIKKGTAIANEKASETLKEVKQAMGMFF